MGIDVYCDVKDKYRNNINKYSYTSYAQQAITTCGEFRAKTAQNTPTNSGCGHGEEEDKFSVLSNFVT